MQEQSFSLNMATRQKVWEVEFLMSLVLISWGIPMTLLVAATKIIPRVSKCRNDHDGNCVQE